MRFPTFSRALALVLAAPLLPPALVSAAEKPETLVIWPGYVVPLPPSHCVAQDNGPDFHVLYFRDQSPKHVNLVGVYAGHHPNFTPDCVKPETKKRTVNGLEVESVRGKDGCAEFLVHDTANERGYLHIWFCPGAKAHPEMAEAFVASIRPAPLPLKDLPDPPACK